MRRAVLLSVLLGAAAGAHGAPPTAPKIVDECAHLLPRSLLKVVTAAYPGSHLGSSLDYAPEDLAKFRDQGQPCPAVDTVDITGDGKDDYGFLLVTSTQDVLLLVATSQPRDHWKLNLLLDWGDSVVSGLYVSSIDPGKYEDLDAAQNAPAPYEPEPGRVKKFTAARPGFISGKIDSSGVAFFYADQRWVHLWLAN